MVDVSAKAPLRILLLEDREYDRELIHETLMRDDLDCRFVNVATRKDFEAALQQNKFDLIITDYSLPSYDGMSALATVRKMQLETPFVLVSGTIGEERAVESLKAGATDCVMKDRLYRLGPIVRRALREVEEREKRKEAEESVRIHSEQLRALAARLDASREEERKEISREIHDELGEALTALKLGLAWIRNRLDARDKPVPWKQIFAKMDVLGALADTTASRVREICTELRPNILDDLGLVPAIQWQAREFQARTDIRCSVRQTIGTLPIPGQQATAVFRIFQEILTNVARHARATKILVSLKKTPAALSLRVADNGRGIKPREITKSIGILGMRERAKLLGGALDIRGLPGKGTTVSVTIPLNSPAASSHGNGHLKFHEIGGEEKN